MEKIKIYITEIWQFKNREPEAFPVLYPMRRGRAEKIKPEEDRLHSIVAGLLLRHVLGITTDEELVIGEVGKPALAGEGPQFNLAHGGNYAVLAVCDHPVGVDVEPIGDEPPIVIPRRYLLPDEIAWLEEDLTPLRYAELWTRLESALKADGRGFAIVARDFSSLENGKPWYLDAWIYDGHYFACATDVPFEIETIMIPMEDLL